MCNMQIMQLVFWLLIVVITGVQSEVSEDEEPVWGMKLPDTASTSKASTSKASTSKASTSKASTSKASTLKVASSSRTGEM